MLQDFSQTQEGRSRTEMGQKREDIVKDFLTNNLPPVVRVEQGEVFDMRGNISRQVDVVISDSRQLALRSKLQNLFPVESVIGTCEVKTELERERLKEAVLNVQSVKRLGLNNAAIEMRLRRLPYGAVFAFGGSHTTIRKNLEELYKELSVPPAEQIDLICVLNEFIGIGHPGNQGLAFNKEHEDLQRSPLIFIRSGKDSLLLFVVLLQGEINRGNPTPFNLWGYLRPYYYEFF